MSGYKAMPRWLHHFWIDYSASYLQLAWSEDYDENADGPGGFYIEPPMWVWRPWCWAFGHSDDSYGACVICQKVLT